MESEILDVRRLLRQGPQLRPGEFLGDGRYELLEPIGKGGFATVWKAWDAESERLVALKVLHGHHGEDRSRRERFFRGAHKMADLAHPHLVRVLASDLEEDGWCRPSPRALNLRILESCSGISGGFPGAQPLVAIDNLAHQAPCPLGTL